MSTPTHADHHTNPTQYPICGRCNTVWRQRGNRTGHCANCHETFEGLSLFHRHQHLDDNGNVTCTDPADIRLGKAQTPLQFVDGTWQGPRMAPEVIARRFGRQSHAETAI